MRIQKRYEQHSMDTVIVQLYRRQWESLSFGQGCNPAPVNTVIPSLVTTPLVCLLYNR